jgi:sec-independent protein translocase protein TatB
MFASPPIQYDVLGWSDSLILMVLALVVFGPRRLPQIGRQLGKLMYEFRKASNDFKFQMEEELRVSEDADRRKNEAARQQALAAENPAQSALPQPATPEVVPSPYPGEEVYPPFVTNTAASDEPSQQPETPSETVTAEQPVPALPVSVEVATTEPVAPTAEPATEPAVPAAGQAPAQEVNHG